MISLILSPKTLVIISYGSLTSGNSCLNSEALKIINFKTTLGNKTTLEIDRNCSIEELLKKYLDKINKTDIINSTDESLYFTYNAEKLEFGDKRKIEDVFASNNNPTVLVSEF